METTHVYNSKIYHTAGRWKKKRVSFDGGDPSSDLDSASQTYHSSHEGREFIASIIESIVNRQLQCRE